MFRNQLKGVSKAVTPKMDLSMKNEYPINTELDIIVLNSKEAGHPKIVPALAEKKDFPLFSVTIRVSRYPVLPSDYDSGMW